MLCSVIKISYTVSQTNPTSTMILSTNPSYQFILISSFNDSYRNYYPNSSGLRCFRVIPWQSVHRGLGKRNWLSVVKVWSACKSAADSGAARDRNFSTVRRIRAAVRFPSSRTRRVLFKENGETARGGFTRGSAK